VRQRLTAHYGDNVTETSGSSSISASGVLVPYYQGVGRIISSCCPMCRTLPKCLPLSEELGVPLRDCALRNMTGPRETLEDRLRMFYSYWNPGVRGLFSTLSLSATYVRYLSHPCSYHTTFGVVAPFSSKWSLVNPLQKVSKAEIVLQHFKGSEDLVNQALHSKYFCDLHTPEKEIMRKAHMAAKYVLPPCPHEAHCLRKVCARTLTGRICRLYKLFELIMPKNMMDKMAGQVPRLVVQYFGRDLELNEWLERNYGVGLDVVFLSVV
jgi:hypothetical protein